MKNINSVKNFVMILLLGVMLLAPIAAFGVSTPYMKEINGVRTFEVYEENAEDFEVVLQSGSENPMNVRVTIIEGSDVIELLEENDIFLVNPDEKFPVNFRILSPPGSSIGDSFHVRLGFASSEVGEGALAFGTAIEKGFDVLLVEMPVFATPEQEKDNTQQFAIIISVSIILLLILVIIVLKFKGVQKKKALANKQATASAKKSAPKNKK